MAVMNCELELKLNWTKYFDLSAASANNVNANNNSVIFTIKDTKVYVPVVTLPAKD